ncbi:MAG: putative Sco1/SenC family protein [Frankiales bacterium]|jgi:protein SCO1/2|nr:putative Sco1/SenC family protein [Frankiales bacterium]
MSLRRTAAALGLVLLATGCAGQGRAEVAPVAAGAAYHGVEPQPVPTRPSFVLRDTAGNRYDFGKETAGTPTLLYFGYTSCPDECPTAMADIAAALRQSDDAVRDNLEVVFVTTDPARDTPAVLRQWLAKFSTRVVGLVGSQAEVDAAQKAVGIPVATKAGAIPTLPGKPNEHVHKPGTAPHTHDGPLGYGVNHANVIFAYDAGDRLPVLYPAGVTAADIAADLPLLARTSTAQKES